MSKIDKLSVQGIRAFSPSKPEAIQFNTPLTLIVGQNGSGKTTIIESLRYTTTGEMPPNAKGAAFIHDPDLTTDSVIPAQVKLAFFSTSGQRLVVTRNLEVAKKKDGKGRTFRTKEGSLKILHGTERTTISSKVAELDNALPGHLGVSAAVLDLVIFCHQDESLWPMNEPTALKKKFDDIFEAERYTKAVDALKKLRKEQGGTLKDLKTTMNFDKQTKEQGERNRKETAALIIEIDKIETRTKEMQEELNKISEAAKAKRQSASSFMGIKQKLESHRESLKRDEQNVAEMEESIEIRKESDSWLKENLAQYETRVQELRDQLEEQGAEYSRLNADLNSTRTDLQAKNNEQGQHQAHQARFEKQLDDRGALIQKSATLHQLRGYDGDLSDKQVREFSKRLQEVFGGKKRALDNLKKSNTKENDESQLAINDLEAKKNHQTQKRKFAKDRTAEIDKKTTALQRAAMDLKYDPSAQHELESKLEHVNELLQKANDNFTGSNFEKNIKDAETRKKELEVTEKGLNSELDECIRLTGANAKLHMHREDLEKKTRKLESLKKIHGDKLSTKLNGPWNASSLKDDFESAVEERRSDLEKAKQSQGTRQADLRVIDSKLSALNAKLRQATQKMDHCEKIVMKALIATKDADENEDELSVDFLPDCLEDAGEEIKRLGQDLALNDAMKDYWKLSQEVLEKKNKCGMCNRHFEGQHHDKEKLQKKIEKNIATSTAEIKKALDASQKKHATLKQVEPSYETYQRLKQEEVPDYQRQIKSETSAQEAAVRRLEQDDNTVKEAQDELDDIEDLTKPVSAINSIHNDIVEVEKEIKQTQQPSDGQLRSVGEVRGELATCREKLEASNSTLETLKTGKQRKKDEINDLNGEIRDIKLEIANAKGKGVEKANLDSQINSLKEEHARQRMAMNEADRELEKLSPEIAEKKDAQEKALEKGREKQQSAEEEMNRAQESVKELERIERDINDYLDRDGPGKLATIQQQIVDLERNKKRLEKDCSLVTAQVNKLRNEIQSSDSTKRTIQDNLRLRKASAALHALEQEIHQLEARGAVEDYDRLIEEAERYDAEYTALNSKKGALLGQMHEKDNQVKKLDAIWTSEFKGAARKYRETLIRHKTTEGAILDIGTYAQALDNAIMGFHARKMQEINQIIGELWQTTYQGTDIDTILIRSDVATEKKTERRNYNYRVCMVKQDTEMDMRGRCSAGQRVLACIIIRLALAESFGVNCGLIALDEPTTNLDADNIRSLAVSLHAIIKARQAQSNFQLIVITHDEEFLRAMQSNDFCDTFYRISRDEQQNSTISRVSINQLIEG